MRVAMTGSVRRGLALAISMVLLASVAAAPAALAAVLTPSTTTLGAPSLDPKPVGQTATITASVTPGATGDVDFLVDDVATDTVALSGSSADFVIPADLAAGSHDIKAQYKGDSTYDVSESSTVSVVVGPRPVAVTITGVSGSHDASGATAQKGDLLSIAFAVADNGTTGSLPVAGSVQIKVDGVVKATVTLPTTTTGLATAAWALGAHSIVATYQPGVGVDHATGSSAGFPITIAVNVVEAVGWAPSPATFYPYKDGYKDTTKLRGVRNETASVTVRIYSPSGKLVRTLSVASGIGTWSVTWNGRNTAGKQVAAGRYKVKQTVRDALGLSRTLPAVYVNVSSKRLYSHTVTLRKSTSQLARNGGTWYGWTFTLPSATVYKKLVFSVYGKTGAPAGLFGPHNFAGCGAGWDWYNCMAPWATFPSSAAWKSVTGSVAQNRSGRTVRMYAVGGHKTAVKYARVVVTYATLK